MSTLLFWGRKVKLRVLEKLSEKLSVLLNWIFLELSFVGLFNPTRYGRGGEEQIVLSFVENIPIFEMCQIKYWKIG